jgi:hypothetical protein
VAKGCAAEVCFFLIEKQAGSADKICRTVTTIREALSWLFEVGEISGFFFGKRP